MWFVWLFLSRLLGNLVEGVVRQSLFFPDHFIIDYVRFATAGSTLQLLRHELIRAEYRGKRAILANHKSAWTAMRKKLPVVLTSNSVYKRNGIYVVDFHIATSSPVFNIARHKRLLRGGFAGLNNDSWFNIGGWCRSSCGWSIAVMRNK